jgi:pimeloyl-ACP methyl ester carboxylesterase
MYYEVLGGDVSERFPVLFVPGGGATGSAFRRTCDNRPGWADLLAERGYQCWVTDWPGTGRSGGRNPLEVQYSDIVDGYVRLVRDVIQQPVIVLCHSMGGPATWALVETAGDYVAAILSVAASAPANVSAPPPIVLADDGRVISVKFGLTGVAFTIDRLAPYIYEDAYIYQQGIANSQRFPMKYVNHLRASMIGIPPTVVLQKIGVLSGFPRIEDSSNFQGLNVSIIAGDRDPAHTRTVEENTQRLLESWGASVRMNWLPDEGVSGNGHFLYSEDNSDELLAIIDRELRRLDQLTHA